MRVRTQTRIPAALKKRLASMSKKQLRIHAESLGVQFNVIEQFRDDGMTRAEFIDLLALLSRAKKRASSSGKELGQFP